MIKKIMLICFLIFSTSAIASPIKNIVFFGDSLSDNGNLYAITGIPKSPPYYQGRFSNGPTWAEDFANDFYKKYYSDSQNFAYGGATTIFHKPNGDNSATPILLEEEIKAYLLKNRNEDKKNTLFVFWIGANDYLNEPTLDTEQLTTDVVNKIKSSIDSLIEKGGQYFLIANLPDLSKTPYSNDNHNQDKLKSYTEAHNKKLAEMINDLAKKDAAVKFYQLDVYAILNDLTQNPQKYNEKYHMNLTDLTTSCWAGGYTLQTLNLNIHDLSSSTPMIILNNKMDQNSLIELIQSNPSLKVAYDIGGRFKEGETPCANPNEHLFWDSLHPTSIVHQMLGEIALETVES